MHRRIAAMNQEHFRILVSQQELQQPVLMRLKTGGLAELIAKCRVVRRRHRGQNIPRLRELRLNAGDARQHLERRSQVVTPDLFPSCIEFVQT